MSSPSRRQRRRIHLTVTALVALMVLFVGLFVNKMLSPRVLSEQELRHNNIVLFEQAREIKAFTLVDHQGGAFTKDDLKGKASLIFFGFTHCPDVCPGTLAELSRIYNRLPAAAQAQLQIILVTLDPARDTVEQLAPYVNYFHEETIGVTGSFPSIMSFARNVNVAFHKVMLEGEQYTIDHTSHTIIINAYGDYAGFIKAPLPEDALPRILESTLLPQLLSP